MLSLTVTHGGSMRYTIAHKGVKKVSKNVLSKVLISKERDIGFDKEGDLFRILLIMLIK